MTESLTIDEKNKLPAAQDYYFLRKEGIKLIESLSGKIWTDYNTHDPGITLLEVICYALTDIGYRTGYDVKDLLAPDAKSSPDLWKKIFHTARQILPCNPLTIIDFRKLIIDTDGVRNAWIEKSDDYEILMYLEKKKIQNEQSYSLTYDYKKADEVLRLRGLYKVFVEYEDEVLEDKREEQVAAVIWQKLQNHRNLTEDFVSVSSVEYEYFPIEGIIQVSEGTDIEMINARIYKVIHDFFSPAVNFYSLEQMLEKKASAEEIFEGPILNYGFIDTDELIKSERSKNIHLSDIINLISGIEGVIAVKQFSFGLNTKSPFSNFTEWVNNAKDRQKLPRLDTKNSSLTFLRSGDRHRTDAEKKVNRERVDAMFEFLKSESFKTRLKGAGRDLEIPAGEYMDIAEYYPFQKNLPVVYGMMNNYVGPNDKIDKTIIHYAVTELLAEKIGVTAAQLINALLNISDDQQKKNLKTIIKDLLAEGDPSLIVVKDLISDLLKEEDDRRIKDVLNKLYGKNVTSYTKSTLSKFIDDDTSRPRPSLKSETLRQLAEEQFKLSLIDVNTVNEIEALSAVYQRYRIDRLDKEKKLVLQLRGFLMVFEQILADYLSQLAHIRDIFSFDDTVKNTFYPQIIKDIEDLEVLFLDFKHYKKTQLQMLETASAFQSRRNTVLDHLISRYAESMNRYSFLMEHIGDKKNREKLIKDKINFLTDYVEISSYRGRGYNYANPDQNWNSNNVEGIKKRICRLLGIENYKREKIAPRDIYIEKITLDNNVQRYVVKLTEKDNKSSLLLQSKEYEFETEAINTLTYFLEEGDNSVLYSKEGHNNKWHFELKRKTPENIDETVAYSKTFDTAKERDSALNNTISVFTRLSLDENFHVIEHILLRPKIGTRERGEHKDEVILLPTEYVPEEIHSTDEAKEQMAYKFKIVHTKDAVKKERNLWKLSLLKDDTELLTVDDEFVFYKHLVKRVELIREFASDRSNYIQTVRDAQITFSIKNGDKTLATGRKIFRNQEDLDKEIENLVHFFSHELGITDSTDDNTPSFYADPYSFQLSIFIPTWQRRFRNVSFKHLLEKTIYLETPSHIYAHVYWLDHNQMRELDEAYEIWTNEMATNDIPSTDIVNNMITVFKNLK